MTKFTGTILTVLVGFIASNTFANDTENKLQNLIERRVQKLNVAIKQFSNFKKAYESTPAENREAVLRKICRRMKNETASVDTAIDAMDTYLDIQAFGKKDQIELDRTKSNISNLKSEIEQLKRSLGSVNESSTVAAK